MNPGDYEGGACIFKTLMTLPFYFVIEKYDVIECTLSNYGGRKPKNEFVLGFAREPRGALNSIINRAITSVRRPYQRDVWEGLTEDSFQFKDREPQSRLSLFREGASFSTFREME